MSRLQQHSEPAKNPRHGSHIAQSGAADVTRHISPSVACELWARAAGRCEFGDCNRLLYKSPVTEERVNISEKAHIYSFSPHGPRGRGPYSKNTAGLNDVHNLLLVCHDCHKTIDQDKTGLQYSADLLKKWKTAHEARIALVTRILPKRKSHVTLFGANIGSERSPLQFDECAEAMFPSRFPAHERPVVLSMVCEHDDSSKEYWKTEAENLRAAFERYITPLINEASPCHFPLFGLAPQPLLILLGSLFTDKIPVDVYQLHREPRTWSWQSYPNGFEFRVTAPQNLSGEPALIIAVSAKINHDRASKITGPNVSIWELTTDTPHNDILKSEGQLAMFRQAARNVMLEIASAHGQNTPLKIFPAMPMACAIELGRIRMPKAEMPWLIFDQNATMGKFIEALSIGATT